MDQCFEWDTGKARRNEAKHGVTFIEVKTVFDDPFGITIPDPDHSAAEQRWLELGISESGKLLVVCYTERREIVRIISCRPASKSERKSYEDEASL